MNILFGVTGCVAAYKAVDIVSGLKKNGHTVSVIATDNALNFVTSAAITNVAHKLWEYDTRKPIHIYSTDDVDAFVVAPLTANTIAKIVFGIADNLLTEAILALDKDVPKFACPAMNTRMWLNKRVQSNIGIMQSEGWVIIPPAYGELACGTTGEGKLPPTKEIVSKILKSLDNKNEL